MVHQTSNGRSAVLVNTACYLPTNLDVSSQIILGMASANERQCYNEPMPRMIPDPPWDPIEQTLFLLSFQIIELIWKHIWKQNLYMTVTFAALLMLRQTLVSEEVLTSHRTTTA